MTIMVMLITSVISGVSRGCKGRAGSAPSGSKAKTVKSACFGL